MSDPTMDSIERGLREMTEPHNADEGEQTELWKKALEISRADERSALTHPGRQAEFEPKPAPGRRLFLALNGVGVAALVVLAAGVWTLSANAPSPSEQAALADEIDAASARAEAMPEAAFDKPDALAGTAQASEAEPGARSRTLADRTVTGDESFAAPAETEQAKLLAGNELIADLRAEKVEQGDFELRLSPDPSRSRRASEDLALDDVRDEAPSRQQKDHDLADRAFADRDEALMSPVQREGERPPGMLQTPMALEEGRLLGRGSASVFAEPSVESANIVIEVDDVDKVYVALSELPQAELGEFSTIEPNDALALTLNFAPSRLDEALGRIHELGGVVEETRVPDSQLRRVNEAMSNAASVIEPIRETFEDYGLHPGMTEHERNHILARIPSDELMTLVERAVEDITRQIEDAQRSVGLSRIRVSIKPKVKPDTIEE